jgi:hypothetical protein
LAFTGTITGIIMVVIMAGTITEEIRWLSITAIRSIITTIQETLQTGCSIIMPMAAMVMVIVDLHQTGHPMVLRHRSARLAALRRRNARQVELLHRSAHRAELRQQTVHPRLTFHPK